MRVLSISHRLQHRLVDNHSIFNAPAIFDYDAIVVDAGGVYDSVRAAARLEAEFQTFSDVAVVNGASLDGATGIADVLQRRHDEFVRALDRGAVVVVFTYPPAILTDVQGMPGLDRYFFLPAPEGMAWNRVTIRGGEGATLAIVDPDHPLAPVLDVLRDDVLYRAYFDDRAPGVVGRGRVFARSAGGGIVGVEFPVLSGRVIFMPTPREAGAVWLAAHEGEALVDAMAVLLQEPSDDRPGWVTDTDVPGLAALEVAVASARAARERAEAEEHAADEAAAACGALRDVLWEGAAYRLLPAAARCAELLGFEVQEERDDEEATDGDVDALVLTCPEGELHAVAEGANDAVGMSPHYRLRRRLDTLIERRAEAPRGLVIANGQRLERPEERTREYIDALRVAAEATGYALVTSRWLFVGAVAAIEGLPDETLAAIRRRLLETDGLVELTDLLVPADEEGVPSEDEDATRHGVDAAPTDDAAGEATEITQPTEAPTEGGA